MPRRLKIYLDTSVISFLFADDAPDKRDATIQFFQDFIRLGIYDTYISEFVTAEIENTNDKIKRQNMLTAIDQYYIENIEVNNRVELDHLAAAYITEGIIPQKKALYAFHIAMAVSMKWIYW